MKTFILAFLCILGTFHSQAQTEKNVGEFKELKVYDLIEVKLVKSDENKIRISGENTQDVVFVNKNGVLKIRMALKKIFDGNKTQVTLFYTNMDIIDANEGAYIYSDDLIKQFDLKLRAQEGGLIKIILETSFLDVKSTTGATIEAKGHSKKQNISLNTGGIYKGEHLNTEQTEVSIVAAGEAYVKASKLVDVKIRVGGDVYIYGNPETVNENKAIGGRVKRMD
ncbi:head GIN domain-containing protein [Flavobacteriaceae bacterium LMO-SS05]